MDRDHSSFIFNFKSEVCCYISRYYSSEWILLQVKRNVLAFLKFKSDTFKEQRNEQHEIEINKIECSITSMFGSCKAACTGSHIRLGWKCIRQRGLRELYCWTGILYYCRRLKWYGDTRSSATLRNFCCCREQRFQRDKYRLHCLSQSCKRICYTYR